MYRLSTVGYLYAWSALVVSSGFARHVDESWIGSWLAGQGAQSLCVAFTGTETNPTANVSYGNDSRYETVAVRQEGDDAVSFDLPDAANARVAGIRGTVRVKAVVLPNGSVGPVVVERGLGYGLDERAMEAVKKWKFTPPSPDCRPLNTAINIEMSFK